MEKHDDELRTLITHARVARCDGAGSNETRLRVIEDGAVAVGADGRIVFVGASADAPPPGKHTHVVDAKGALLTPGLVDPHTHLVFAGRRTGEFEQKMRGVDYRTIAAQGGGILSTVSATRAADRWALLETARRRLRIELEHGVTTVEVKSGYGLTLDDELKLLRVGREASGSIETSDDDPKRGQRVARTVTTLLGAHAVPPEHRGDREGYVSLVCREMIPAAARESVASAVDVYLDEGAFTLDEARAILGAARGHGLAVKAHVGQFRDLGGAELVAELGGLSCDHLEEVSDAGLRAMAQAGTTAVLLPAAWRTLRQRAPDAARIAGFGARIAIGTDCNPGTSPCLDLPMCAALAVRDAGLSATAALLSITVDSAAAIGASDVGRIALGARGDLALWDHDDPGMFAYVLGGLAPRAVWLDGHLAVHEQRWASAF